MKSILKSYKLNYGDYTFEGLKLFISNKFKTGKECNDWFESRFQSGTDDDRMDVERLIREYLRDKFHVYVTWLWISKIMPFICLSLSIILYSHILISILIIIFGGLWFVSKWWFSEKLKVITYSIENDSDLNEFTMFFDPEVRDYYNDIHKQVLIDREKEKNDKNIFKKIKKYLSNQFLHF